MNLGSLGKNFALSILNLSRHRGHDLWRDLRFFSKQIGKSDGSDLVFLDVGANVGQTVERIRSTFRTASIHAFEPCSSTFSLLSERFRDSPGVHPHNLGCGDESVERELYLGEYSTINSFVRADRSLPSQKAKVVTIDDFLSDHGINAVFLLKSDTEGCDLNVLRGAVGSLKAGVFDYILVETRFHITMELPQSSFAEVSCLLASFNYHFCHSYEAVYSTKGGQTLWCNALFSKH